jgi:ADP-ribosylglycohydrolase
MTGGGGDAADLFATVLAHTPDGETRRGIERAARLDPTIHVRNAASTLGNGSRVIASDTVPFSLWCAARHMGDFAEAMWSTVAGLGDRDTTCAIVGGIVAMHPDAKVPPDWLNAREPLESMAKETLGL